MTEVTDEAEFDDAGFRAVLAAAAAAEVEVDVDREWGLLSARLETAPGRPWATWAAVAAAIILVLSTVGRPVVDAGGGVIARFLGDRVEQVGRGVSAPFTSDEPDPAHGKVDKKNPFWVEIRSVHDTLNDAVGWDRWRPKELKDAADRLDRIAANDPRFTDRVREAAKLIRSAQADNRRDDAVAAHRLIFQIELALANP